MKIAVAATTDYAKVAGHAGRSRRWLVFATGPDGAGQPERVELPPQMVFHHFEGDNHPLDGIEALIALSAGEGFLARMRRFGVDAVLTAERNPARAVEDYLADRLSGPRPRPVGTLICKAIDLFSKHK